MRTADASCFDFWRRGHKNPKNCGQESCPCTTTYFILFHNNVRMSEATSSEAHKGPCNSPEPGDCIAIANLNG